MNGVTTRYLVDDLNPTGYSQVVEESVNGAVQRSYSYGLQRIDLIQLVNNTSTLSFYGYDGFGNVPQLTNSTGAVTDTYEYDAFGNQLNKTGTTPNNYLYRGEQWEPDLNLYYLRARYYNPLSGRFMSRDPEDGNPADPKTLHKYLYVGGDPVNALDPMGRDIFDYQILTWRCRAASGWSHSNESGEEIIKTHWLLSINSFDRSNDRASTDIGEDASFENERRSICRASSKPRCAQRAARSNYCRQRDQ